MTELHDHPALEMDWKTVGEHIRAGKHNDSGRRASRIRGIMRKLGLLGQHEDLTELGKRLSRSEDGVLQQVLEDTYPTAFHTPPDEMESLWPLASPLQATRYANNLRRMVSAAALERAIS